MLDGRVLEASQVQYKPFGKPSLQREVAGMQGFPALNSPHDLIQKCSMADSCCRNIATKLRATCRHRSRAKPLNSHSPPARCYMCYMCYILHAKPLNSHSPPARCYMCYMCYILHAKPLNPHSPPARCYMCYMCYILHAKPLNPHSPPAPCYMYYMCYILCTREICTICAI